LARRIVEATVGAATGWSRRPYRDIADAAPRAVIGLAERPSCHREITRNPPDGVCERAAHAGCCGRGDNRPSRTLAMGVHITAPLQVVLPAERSTLAAPDGRHRKTMADEDGDETRWPMRTTT
jgi:hypothetical protein